MMNSSRASPTPALGRARNENARSGLPTFIATLKGRAGMVSTSSRRSMKSSLPA